MSRSNHTYLPTPASIAAAAAGRPRPSPPRLLVPRPGVPRMRYAPSFRRDVSAAAAASAVVSASSATTEKDGVSPSVLAAPPPAAAAATQEKEKTKKPHPPPPPLSRDDASFLEQGLEFVYDDHGAGIDLGQLNDLFEKVGFPRREPERLAAALTHTPVVLWVRASRGSRWAKAGSLVGFARATSDGALAATIWDVAVSPAWQRGGVGGGLIERVTRELLSKGVRAVSLYAEPGVVGLYERLGFVTDPGGAKGMAFQKTSGAGGDLLRRAVERAKEREKEE